MTEFLWRWATATFELLADSALYVLIGLLIAGLVKVFLSPQTVAKHLGGGSLGSVIKAALIGIPLPLCSCGVLPAAASLKRQGASRGATTSFLVSTPETGVDSIAISYALLGPVMTIARPVAAFAAAVTAGLAENLLGSKKAGEDGSELKADLSCPVDGCCDGLDCPASVHARHHTFWEKLRVGMRFALTELWADLAGWFVVGLLLAGLIAALVPDDVLSYYFGGGIWSMLLMLTVGIPIYICATGSTPVAATLLAKGVSPGTALVFLLTGPATNITSLSVLIGVLGKRATIIYVASIALVAVAAGLALDGLFLWFGWSLLSVEGQAHELIPGWLEILAALAVVALTVKPLTRTILAKLRRQKGHGCCSHDHKHDGHDHGQGHSDKEHEATCCSGST